jgi:hypothetical protein
MQRPTRDQNRIDDDAMDIDDELILSDVTTLRASTWQATNDSIFEDAPTPEDVRAPNFDAFDFNLTL